MPTRPRFHYTPPRGWMNDPMGITWRDGRYHLFFQCIPDSSQLDAAVFVGPREQRGPADVDRPPGGHRARRR